jgi:hypothetical protein
VPRKLLISAVTVILLVVGLALAAWRSTLWPKAAQFRNSLQCDMALGAALALADATGATFSVSELQSDGLQVATAREGRVAFQLYFLPTQGAAWLSTGKLQAIQRLDYYGFTGVTADPRESLCSGP